MEDSYSSVDESDRYQGQLVPRDGGDMTVITTTNIVIQVSGKTDNSREHLRHLQRTVTAVSVTSTEDNHWSVCDIYRGQ